MALRVAAAVAAAILSCIGVPACSTTTQCTNSGGHTVDCPVQADTTADHAATITARISGELRENDGISVNVQSQSRDLAMGPGITLTAQENKNVGIITRDHWLDDKTAQRLARDANKEGTDYVDRTILLIDKIHEWQDRHPRPAQTVQPAAKPVPPPTEKPGTALWDPFVHIMSWAFTTVVIIVLSAAGGVALYKGSTRLMDSRRTWLHQRRLLHAEREKELAEICARADLQNEAFEHGDFVKGVYGDYPPNK